MCPSCHILKIANLWHICLHLPLLCMWQTLLINHMTFSSKVQSGIQILNTVLLAAATNGLALSSHGKSLCHASDFRDRETEDQKGKIIHSRSYGKLNFQMFRNIQMFAFLFFHLIKSGS